MASEPLSPLIEIYRFNEANNTYTSLCILIFNKHRVTIKGLSSPIDLKDSKELADYLINKGVTKVYYERRKLSGTLYKRWDLRSLNRRYNETTRCSI